MAQNPKTLATDVARYIDEAWLLVGQGALDDAHATLAHAHQIAKAGGLRSAFLLWGLAVVADLRDYAEDAVHFIMAALRLEPCAPPILKSYVIILKKTQNTFAELKPSDPVTCPPFPSS